ncbi:MAG: phage holin family protein [Bacteroidales bacterium]
MNGIMRLLLYAFAVYVTAELLPGIHITGFFHALLFAVILGVFNWFVKPLLIIFTLPVTILTLGLFLLLINGITILLASSLVPGFYVDGLGWAILFSLVLALVNGIIELAISE